MYQGTAQFSWWQSSEESATAALYSGRISPASTLPLCLLPPADSPPMIVGSGEEPFEHQQAEHLRRVSQLELPTSTAISADLRSAADLVHFHRAFSLSLQPTARVTRRLPWREQMRQLHRCVMHDGDERLGFMRTRSGGGIEKREKAGGGGARNRKDTFIKLPSPTPCAACGRRVSPIWSVSTAAAASASSAFSNASFTCSCSTSDSSAVIPSADASRATSQFFAQLSRDLLGNRHGHSRRHHRFTYSYKIDYSLPVIIENDESEEPVEEAESSAALAGFPRPLSSPDLPALESLHIQQQPAETGVVSTLFRHPLQTDEEDAICSQLRALPLGLPTGIAHLESALLHSLSLGQQQQITGGSVFSTGL